MIVDQIHIEFRIWNKEDQPGPWRKAVFNEEQSESDGYDIIGITGIGEAFVHQRIMAGDRRFPKPKGFNATPETTVEIKWLGQAPFKVVIQSYLRLVVDGRYLPETKGQESRDSRDSL